MMLHLSPRDRRALRFGAVASIAFILVTRVLPAFNEWSIKQVEAARRASSHADSALALIASGASLEASHERFVSQRESLDSLLILASDVQRAELELARIVARVADSTGIAFEMVDAQSDSVDALTWKVTCDLRARIDTRDLALLIETIERWRPFLLLESLDVSNSDDHDHGLGVTLRVVAKARRVGEAA